MFRKRDFCKRYTKYSFYLFVLLIILDVVSTYIGLTYFNLHEANPKTALLFELFGIMLSSGFKLLTVAALGHFIRLAWNSSDSLIQNTGGWMSSVAMTSSLIIVSTVLFLNAFYFLVVLNNLNLIYIYF